MKTDIEIANSIEIKPIYEIADKLGIDRDLLEPYGRYKAKLPLSLIDKSKIDGKKLILVSAISPTPAGEGKTTISIGLTEGLNRIGKQATVVLREPSLGPVFGIKGGATGGGYSQVVPMEDINLHFTGDFGAIEKAHNLLSALIDNNIQSKTHSLNIDPRTVTWKRVMDMNDRSLRHIIVGLGGTSAGIPRETGFDITAASEVMAILCLSDDFEDLKNRLGNIFIGYTFDKKPIYARDLHAHGAMAALLKDAIKPNLVQTLEGNPAIIHGGPFANIAQGTNSIIATRMGLTLSDYVVTEAGFGFDLGAEKFFDIKCVKAGLKPSAVVMVATVRALKYHGGAKLDQLKEPNLEALKKGVANLEKQVENMKKFNICPVVAINKFVTDTDEEIAFLADKCKELEVPMEVAEVWAKGGEGGVALAEEVVRLCEQPNDFTYAYDLEGSIEEKLNAIVQKIYGGSRVVLTANAQKQAKQLEALGFGNCPICMAKTQYSLTDDQTKLGAPTGFEVTVRNLKISAGAGFIVALTGDIMTMPGLPKVPAAERIDVDATGKITGLF